MLKSAHTGAAMPSKSGANSWTFRALSSMIPRAKRRQWAGSREFKLRHKNGEEDRRLAAKRRCEQWVKELVEAIHNASRPASGLPWPAAGVVQARQSYDMIGVYACAAHRKGLKL